MLYNNTKHYYEKRFNREIERRRRRKYLRKLRINNVSQEHNEPTTVKEQHKLEIQIAPNIFNLFTNTEEYIQFFSTIRQKMEGGNDIYFDMSEIKKIDVSSIIYLLSIFKYDYQDVSTRFL